VVENVVKTNAMRLLEQAGIDYEVRTYPVDEEHLDGMSVAKETGLDPDQTFKTLTARGEKQGILVFCIPVNEELDLKKAAKAAGDKRVEMLPLKELLPVTGYIRGGCSPIGMKKKYKTFLNETAVLFDEIAVSGGQRGTQILIAPDDLLSFTEGGYADLT
jgi:Cys-tRNA(Pro)/Cys-tRNA(Cys) deacylase